MTNIACLCLFLINAYCFLLHFYRLAYYIGEVIFIMTEHAMDVFDILNMIGGLCLFLFGMSVMGDGFTPRSLRLTQKNTVFPINYLPKTPQTKGLRCFLC